MGQKSVKGNEKLAQAIKMRRNELNLTIEEAATRAGVGTKTWCRYEAGESIRQDKCKGICKALNWRGFPNEDEEDILLNTREYENHEAWSENLFDCFGESAAVSFAIGSDILIDYVKDDMKELLKMPRGTHIGQIGVSFLVNELPQQFCMKYDYEFMYALYTTIVRLRKMAHTNIQIVAHTVLEELALYLIVEQSRFLLESSNCNLENDWDEWIFNLFGDMDIITYLYSENFLTEDDCYHFKNWMKSQFYC